jgi:hypothetical protein
LRAITVVHKLKHCFIGFLGGYLGVSTPISLAPTGLGSAGRGEAGFTWEVRVLGGVAVLWYEVVAGVERVKMYLARDGKGVWVTDEALRNLVERSTLGQCETE